MVRIEIITMSGKVLTSTRTFRTIQAATEYGHNLMDRLLGIREVRAIESKA